MDDFNQPQERPGIDDNFKKFAVQIQLDNICRILGGEATHYICTDKKTQHQKFVITYDRKEKQS
jgi:hypothetical protein|tara:strand:- start:6032 stop:6223 length:192 start_codon:yes stop_codon:yes gene_type:complete